MNEVKQFAPHMRRKQSTFSQMMEFFLCLCVLWICAMIFYGVKQGTPALVAVIINGLVSMAFAMLADVFTYLPVFFYKQEGVSPIKEYLYKIVHSYSFVSGLLIALLCPVGAVWYQLGITAFIATFVMKLVFGGFGKNILNPAVFGRVFYQLAFTGSLKTSVEGSITTGSSITSVSSGFGTIMGFGEGAPSLFDLAIGNYLGSLGETFAIVLVLIAIYLSIRGIIDWRTPVFYVGSLYLAFVLMFLCARDGLYAFRHALAYTMVGGIVFGGVLCLTDPVTTPTAKSGRVIMALITALLTFVFRRVVGLPEGVAYSILIVNVLTPFIDKIIKGRTRDYLVPMIVSISLAVVLVAVAILNGVNHPIDPNTGAFIQL
ncbi:MAG: RnfABCDGE type electron transport complex subunit D [Bacilli bacterium]|nr:RnfABCDGE type electron transport complex subunit D [Bacilli bacterium]